MTLETKKWIIAALGGLFLLSLVFVQWRGGGCPRTQAGLSAPHIALPAPSPPCVQCPHKKTPGTIDHWKGSTHARKAVGCVECHQAETGDADAFDHYGHTIATIVTPRDCKRCHETEYQEFSASHHAAGGNILASLDNFLAETVEGS